jgi:hypothetical protein
MNKPPQSFINDMAKIGKDVSIKNWKEMPEWEI